MKEKLLLRCSRVLAWLAGAAIAGVAWYAVSVYGLGLYDEAYGPLAIFQIGSCLALGFAVLGLIGYAAAVTVYGARQTVIAAATAGAVFAFVMQCVAFGLGEVFPSGVPGLLPAFAALVLGGGTAVLRRHHEV